MSYYVEQDDLKSVRAWFEENRKLRSKEAARLEVKLKEADDELEEFEYQLDYREKQKASIYNFGSNDLTPNPYEEGIERHHRSLRQKRWDFTRQLRDLVRWERDDLEWLSTLERKEREAHRQYRSTNDTKQQQRAENWRNRKEAATDE